MRKLFNRTAKIGLWLSVALLGFAGLACAAPAPAAPPPHLESRHVCGSGVGGGERAAAAGRQQVRVGSHLAPRGQGCWRSEFAFGMDTSARFVDGQAAHAQYFGHGVDGGSRCIAFPAHHQAGGAFFSLKLPLLARDYQSWAPLAAPRPATPPPSLEMD